MIGKTQSKLDEILLRRKHMVAIVPNDNTYEQSPSEKSFVIAGLKNIQSLGFTFSKELLVEKLFHLSKNEFEEFYSFLVPELRKLVGADVEYKPMYPNFPKQVAEASDTELFINAIIHYWSFGELLPEYEKNERLPLIDDNKSTLLYIGNKEKLMEIFTNLVSSKTSLSEQDKEDVTTIIKNCPDYNNYLPEEIPLKENVALIGKLILEEAPIKNTYCIRKYFKTATDVLRLITALSDGDISLAGKTRYRNLRRVERRAIMDLLSFCGNITEDLFRYPYEWIRVGEIVHPFVYSQGKYNNVIKAFNTLRNEKKPLMFAGKVQSAILQKDIKTAVELLKSRPGDFARQLDKLIRDTDEPDMVINAFSLVAKEVSSTVLLQVREHFINRINNDNPVRVFFPKGNLAKAYTIKNKLPKIDKENCIKIDKVCGDALIKKFADKKPLGNVYIDEELRNYIVPFSQRSANKAAKTIVRGSKLPINSKAEAIRGFVWWTNLSIKQYQCRVDLDLSAAVYDENWNYLSHISYTNLRDCKFGGYHSGDIVDGGSVDGKGVAEFIDINIDKVVNNGGRYVVYQVYSFTGQKFSEMPNCRFGWMEREDVNSGEIFEPSTIELKMDVNSESTIVIPVIFDCVKREFIWCDMNLAISQSGYGGNNLESNLKGVSAVCYALTHLSKPNLYDLITFNALARGNIVTDRNQADIIFSNDTSIPYEIIIEKDNLIGIENKTLRDKTEVPIITAFDAEYFMSELL